MTKRRTTRRSSRRKKRKLPRIELTRDQQLDIVGYVLLAIAGLTLLSFLSASHGVIPGWWLGVLRQAFGWGAYLTPLLVGAAGLWLVLRDFGDRMPRPTIAQVAGGLLLYVAMLATMHLVSAQIQYRSDLNATAQAGDGGGYAGAALAGLMLRGLGRVGVGVALATGWLIAAMLVSGAHIKDLVQLVKRQSSKKEYVFPICLITVSSSCIPRSFSQGS